MFKYLEIIGLGIVYFLIVYLFIIRREAKPVLPWLVSILVQIASLLIYDNAIKIFCYFLPKELAAPVVSLLLIVLNLAVIYVMFGIVIVNKNKRGTETVKTRTAIKVAPISEIVKKKEEQPVEKSEDNAITISFIQKMLEEGRTDEALKYLKMLAFYSNDKQTKEDAQMLLDKINEEFSKK